MRQVAKTLKLPVETFMPQGSIPQGLEFVWETFLDLSTTRLVALSYQPITFAEINAWMVVHRVDLERWQISVIRKLDRVWLQVRNDKFQRAAEPADKQ